MNDRAPRAIRIDAGAVSVEARLNDSRTASAIWAALPIEAKAETHRPRSRGGVTGGCGGRRGSGLLAAGSGVLHLLRHDAGQPGRGDPASPVNPVGQVVGDATAFRNVRAGTRVRIERS
jgi:hypothetical protein